jgi:LuxR family maltose regulon positive regulatory protein
LQQALTLAEPEGYVRIFVDEGPPMAKLLGKMNASREGRTLIVKEYIQKLLTAFESNENDINPISSSLHPTSSPGAPRSAFPHPLVEPLSQRELEDLHLFKTELSGPEIDDQLVIGWSTLLTHTKSIYSKLNVGVLGRRSGSGRRAGQGVFTWQQHHLFT